MKATKQFLALSARIADHSLLCGSRKDSGRGFHKPGSKPGNTGCKTLPAPKFDDKGRLVSQRKGTPSTTMQRLRELARSKGGAWGSAGFR